MEKKDLNISFTTPNYVVSRTYCGKLELSEMPKPAFGKRKRYKGVKRLKNVEG